MWRSSGTGTELAQQEQALLLRERELLQKRLNGVNGKLSGSHHPPVGQVQVEVLLSNQAHALQLLQAQEHAERLSAKLRATELRAQKSDALLAMHMEGQARQADEKVAAVTAAYALEVAAIQRSLRCSGQALLVDQDRPQAASAKEAAARGQNMDARPNTGGYIVLSCGGAAAMHE